ncbi:MAG: acyl-CoA dehydrogenase family protein, partial [Acidimicrobiales bacterium]|nr:acyl-CoA dehydrogenase family protein [Acidimicrobiales bacterium]
MPRSEVVGVPTGPPLQSLHGRCENLGRVAVIEWSDEQQMVRATVRDFIEKELVPHHRELEHGDLPPYDIIRRLFST